MNIIDGGLGADDCMVTLASIPTEISETDIKIILS